MIVSIKTIVGISMAFVVLVVASVTLAITYTVSLAAIHETGQRLASSLVNTVSDNVIGFMQTPEVAMSSMATTARYPGYMIPSQDPQLDWWLKWTIFIRALSAAGQWNYTDLSFLSIDGGLIVVGTYANYSDWAYGYVLDAASLPITGNCTLIDFWLRNKQTMVEWNTATQGPGFYPDSFGNQNSASSFYFENITVAAGFPLCFWFPPQVFTYANPNGAFELYSMCTLLNASNAYLGFASAGLSLSGITTFLDATAATPNTQLMLVDSNMQMIASTYYVPAYAFYSPGDPRGNFSYCVSSGNIADRTTRIGCRPYAIDYPYPPLQYLAQSDPAFLSQPGLDQRLGSIDGTTYYYISMRIPTVFLSYYMNLLMFMPENDILGGVTNGLHIAIGVTAAVFVFAVVFANVLVQVLLRPLDSVTRRMYRVANMDDGANRELLLEGEDEEFTNAAAVNSPEPLVESKMTEIRALQVAYETMDTAISSFTRYVPRDVVRELVTTGQICEISMRPARCSVMFADIVGFTALCEAVPPPVLSHLVHVYFERASCIVMGHGGIIDKFIGDCVMAVWGAPVPIEHHEIRSAVCGRMLAYEATADPLKKAFDDVGKSLALRVGVATGDVLAGNLGSAERMSYTVIGDDVNLASRLESLNKQWGTNVLISEDTALECQDWLVIREVVTIAVMGKSEPIAVYEVFGVKPGVSTDVVGAVTSDQSENRSLTELQRDQEKVELAQLYLAKDNKGNSGAKHIRISTGKLLRRAMKKAPVTPEEIEWVRSYNAAMMAFKHRDFTGCMAQLQAALSAPGAPRESKSAQKFIEACEQYLKTPPPADFDGTWRATEK